MGFNIKNNSALNRNMIIINNLYCLKINSFLALIYDHNLVIVQQLSAYYYLFSLFDSKSQKLRKVEKGKETLL